MILTEVKIFHMKTGRKFSVINPNTTFESKQRALDGNEYCKLRCTVYSAVCGVRCAVCSLLYVEFTF